MRLGTGVGPGSSTLSAAGDARAQWPALLSPARFAFGEQAHEARRPLVLAKAERPWARARPWRPTTRRRHGQRRSGKASLAGKGARCGRERETGGGQAGDEAKLPVPSTRRGACVGQQAAGRPSRGPGQPPAVKLGGRPGKRRGRRAGRRCACWRSGRRGTAAAVSPWAVSASSPTDRSARVSCAAASRSPRGDEEGLRAAAAREPKQRCASRRRLRVRVFGSAVSARASRPTKRSDSAQASRPRNGALVARRHGRRGCLQQREGAAARGP